LEKKKKTMYFFITNKNDIFQSVNIIFEKGKVYISCIYHRINI